MQAFIEFTELIGATSDEAVVSQAAVTILQRLIPDCTVGYYRLDAYTQCWQAEVLSDDVPQALREVLRRGLSPETPLFAAALSTRQPIFVDDWNAEREAIAQTHIFRSAAAYPVPVAGRLEAMLTLAMRRESRPTAQDKALFRSVGRNLTLALERNSDVRQLRDRGEELSVLQDVLEQFALLARDLAFETDQYVLIRRAQEIIAPLLPAGTWQYYEQTEDRWSLKSQIGTALTERSEPASSPPPLTAARPLLVQGKASGLFGVQLERPEEWTAANQAVLEAVVSNLSLALERAEQAKQIREQKDALEQQNAQLEARSQALQGFSELTRGLSVSAEPHELAQRALNGIMSLLPEGYATYYELQDGLWRLRALTGDFGNEELTQLVRAGLPYAETRNLTIPWETGQPYYQNNYEVSTDGMDGQMGHVLATACLPVLVDGKPIGVIGCGLFAGRIWTETDHLVLESIVRSLGIAIEGAQGVQALQERTLELQRSNTELERFAYIASHDLQEPIRGMLSFTELLSQRYRDQLDSRGQQYLDFLQRSGQQMKTLVDDILSFSRLSRAETTHRRVAMREPLNEALSRLTVALEESEARIEVSELPEVMGDPPQLAQLFQNLIGNALKFRRMGVAAHIQIGAVPEGMFWHFRVQDNGIGMREEYFQRIFVMFQRLHRRDEYQGSGLGLAICQKIVEGHQGRIWVESQEGVGSTFHFTLPALQAT